MQTQMQGPQPNTVQNQQKKPSRLTWRAVGFIVALLLIIVAGAIWISTGIGSLPNLLTTIFGIVGAILALFQLFPLFFPAKQTVTPDPPPPAPAQTPQIVINVPPSPLPVQPVPPQITPAEAASYRTISSNPPPTDPRTIQQRASVVKEVYTKLCEPDISALVLTGIGGLGKSTLTALVYKYTEEQRRAGNGPFKAEALWFSIDEKTTFVDLAGNLFAALGKPIPDFATMALTNQAAALFNALNAVTEARLIVLDQFENLLDQRTGHALPDRLGIGELIDALNSRSCSCRILLTSRPWPAGMRPYPPTHMQEYPVAGLAEQEGIDLLRKQGVTAQQATEADLKSAVKRCDGHALSLTLLASILRANRSLILQDLLNSPTYAQLWKGDIAHELLDYIYTQQLNVEQCALLQAFSVYREPVPLEAALAILDLDPQEIAEQVLSNLKILLAQHLLQAPGNHLYQLHAIVADYAHDHFDESNKRNNQHALQAVHTKAAQYYLQQAEKVCPPPDKWKHIGDVQPLIEAVWQYCQAEQWQEAYDLMQEENLFAKLKLWGNNALRLELCQLFLSGRWQPKPGQSAFIYNEMGLIHDDLGKKEQALQYYEQSLLISREVGDRFGEGVTLNNLGRVYNSLSKKEQALQYYEQSLLISREVGNRSGEGITLNNLGRVYKDLSKKEQALQHYEQSLLISREVGDRSGEGITLNNLGRVYDDLGKKEQALRYYEQALLIRREVGNRFGEGVTSHNIGTIYMERKIYDVALACFLIAIHIFEEVQSPDVNEVEQWITDLRQEVGEEQFTTLLAQVEPQAQQIVEKALQNK